MSWSSLRTPQGGFLLSGLEVSVSLCRLGFLRKFPSGRIMAAAPPSSAMHCRLTRSLSLAASSSSSTTPPLCSVPGRQRRRCVASVRQWQAFSSRAQPCCLLRPGVVSLFCWRGGIGFGTPGQVRLNSWASSARPRPSCESSLECNPRFSPPTAPDRGRQFIFHVDVWSWLAMNDAALLLLNCPTILSEAELMGHRSSCKLRIFPAFSNAL